MSQLLLWTFPSFTTRQHVQFRVGNFCRWLLSAMAEIILAGMAEIGCCHHFGRNGRNSPSDCDFSQNVQLLTTRREYTVRPLIISANHLIN